MLSHFGSKFWPLLTAALAVLVASAPYAHAQSITIQGKVTDPAGSPVTGSAVQFRVQILTPDANRCVLYDETQTVDLSRNYGLFTLNLNGGLSVRNEPRTYTFDQAIANRTRFDIDSQYCRSGSGTLFFTPTAQSNRRVLIQFKDAAMAAFETIPEMDLNPVPYAIESRNVGGFEASSVLRVADSGAPGTAPLLTTGQATELVNLISGASNNYMSSTNNTTGAKLPTISGNPASLSQGAVWFDSLSGSLKFYNGSAVQTVGTGTGNGTITSITVTAGDLTGGGSGPAVNLGLPNVATAGTYGSSSAVPQIEIDEKGRVKTVTLLPITGTVPGAGAAGEVLKSDGSTWTSGLLRTADIRSTSDNATIFPGANCSAGQTLSWDSVNDKLICTAITLPAPGATVGSYKIVNVAADGRVTGGSNPTTLGGFDIRDAIVNAGTVPSVASGNENTKGAAGTEGRLFVAVDTKRIFRDDGTNWVQIASDAGSGGTLTDVLAGPGLARSASGTTVTLDLPSVGSATTYNKVTTDAYGRVTGGGGLVAGDIPDLDWAKITTGKPTDLNGYGILDAIQALGYAKSIRAGAAGSEGPAGTRGRIYIAESSGAMLYDNGTDWVAISSGSTATLAGDVTGSPGSNTVARVGTSLAADIHTAELAANAATALNTPSTIVKRDASGGFAAGTVSAGSLVLRDSGSNAATIRAPATVSTPYTLELPPAAPAVSGQVLSSTTAGVLSWITPSTTAVSVNGPITNSGSSTAPNIGIREATASQDGYLSSVNFDAFTKKLSSALTSAYLFVGNGSNQATGVAASGDVALDNTGKFTVTGIRGVDVAAGTPVDGQILRYAGSTYSPAFLTMGDLRSTVTGSSALTVGCTASQTLTWNSGTDSLQCTPIGNLSASSINTGVLGVANGGTGATSLTGAGIFVNGGNSFGAAASLGTNDSNDLTIKTNNASVMTITSGARVGVGTSVPNNRLELYAEGAGNSGRLAARNPGDTGAAVIEAQVNNYWSGTSYTGTSLYQYGPSATGNIAGLPTANLGMLKFQNGSAGLVYNNGGPIHLATGAASSPQVSLLTNGRVGIGSASPSELLDVRKDQAGAGTIIRSVNNDSSAATYAGVQAQSDAGLTRITQFSTGAGGSGQLVSNASTLLIDNTSASGVIAFRNGTTPTEKMRINAAGNVGIGTSVPGTMLDVNGQAATIRGTASLPGELRFNATNAGTTYVGFKGPASNPASNVLWQLPAADGASGQVLSTNGSGALSWVSGNAGSVTSITAGTGLTGGTITSSGTIGLGTELAGLNALSTTGVLKRTGAGTYTAGQASLTADVSGALPLANGGTNANLTAVNGGVAYSTASAMAFTAAGSAGQMLRSTGAAAPAWSTATFPNTAAIGDLLYASGANTWSSLAKANTAALVTSSTGVPSWVTGATANRLLRTDGSSITFAQASLATDVTGTLPVANGGTGATTAADKTVFAAPAGGGAPTFRALTAADLPASASYWQAGSPGINYAGGNVGIGTTTPNGLLTLSTTATNEGLAIYGAQTAGNTVGTALRVNLGSGSYNGLSQAGDAGLIFGGTAIGNAKGFVIAPWMSGTGGIRMDGSGKVAIGNANPADLFTVGNSFAFHDGGHKVITFGYSATSSKALMAGKPAELRWDPAGGISLGVDSTTRAAGDTVGAFTSNFYLGSDGKAGIGTTTPTARLEVNGAGAAAGIAVRGGGTVPTYLDFGRTSREATIGFASAANEWAAGSTLGDLVIRGEASTTKVMIGNAANGPVLNVLGNGNVGIGTTNPGSKLELGSGDVRVANGGSFYVGPGAAAGTERFRLHHVGTDSYLDFGTNNLYVRRNDLATALSINSISRVGIGTSYANENLTVMGDGSNSAKANVVNPDYVNGSAGSGVYIGPGVTSGNGFSRIQAYISGNTAGGILAVNPNGGNVGVGTTAPAYKLDVNGNIRGFGITDSSDRRLKRDVTPLEDSLEKVRRLQGVAYFWKDATKGKGRQVGLIAQDVEKVYPELVETDSAGMKSVNYSHLVAPLIDAVKALYEKIKVSDEGQKALRSDVESDRARIMALEAENARLKVESGRELASVKAEAASARKEAERACAQAQDLQQRMERLERLMKK